MVRRLISALIWDISGLWNSSDGRDYREKRIVISRFLTPYIDTQFLHFELNCNSYKHSSLFSRDILKVPTGLNSSLSSSGTISTASVSTQIPQLDQNGDLLEDTKSECNSTEKEMAAIKNNRNGKVRNCTSHFFPEYDH